MAASLTLYSCLAEYTADGTVDLDSDTLKLMLVSSSYTPSATTHTVLADVSANEISATGGYTAGGITLTGNDVARVTTTTTFDMTDVALTASGAAVPAHRYAVCYANVTRNSKVNPLLFYVLGDTTPADVPATADGAVLRYRWNASGVFTEVV